MSTKWDSLTPEQQRAIGTPLLRYVDEFYPFPSNPLGLWGEVVSAVRAAECPTWRPDSAGVVRSDGSHVTIIRTADLEWDALISVVCAALNAHERDTRGLK